MILSNLKSWLRGCHHGVSPQHLQAYLNEFTFRFNRQFYPFNAFRSLRGSADRLLPRRMTGCTPVHGSIRNPSAKTGRASSEPADRRLPLNLVFLGVNKQRDRVLKDVSHRAADRARFVLPPTLMSLAYMLYGASGAYFQDGLLTVHNSDFRNDPKFREAYALRKATGPGVTRTSNGVHTSAAGRRIGRPDSGHRRTRRPPQTTTQNPVIRDVRLINVKFSLLQQISLCFI